MLNFKKVKNLDIWTSENIVGDNFEIIKDICDSMYYVYVNGNKYAVAKTLKTAKKYANERNKY